jgi:hypothetical protein
MWERLGTVRERIGDFLSGSERVFLDTGSRLTGLSERSSQLVAGAEGAVKIGSRDGANPAVSLSHSLELMERHLAQSRVAATEGCAALSRVGESLESLTAASVNFQRVATTLGALATSLRVEDGRKVTDVDFGAVAEDVLRLGRLIQVRFDAILSGASQLRETARRTHARERDYVGKQGQRSSVLLGDVRTSLERLGSLEAATSIVSTKAHAASQGITRAVSSILVSLQTHDITRQMLEHVTSALEDWEGRDRPAAPAGPNGAPASTGLEGLTLLCQVQSGQVSQARADLVRAHEQIAQNLRLMSAEVAVITLETRRLAEDRDGGALLDRVERGAAQAAEALHQHLAHEAEIAGAISGVVSSVAHMEGYIAEIAAMAGEVKMVALNALVKAAKVGAGGAVFAVLAQAIKDLSAEVTVDTEAVSNALRKMAREAQSLSDGATSSRSAADATLVEADLSRAVEALKQYHEHMLTSVVELRRGSILLGTEIEGIARAFERQAAAAAGLENLEADLLDVSEEAAAAGAHAGEPDALGLTARYTMQVERDIHAAVTDGAGSQLLAPVVAASAGSHGLGANVELF